MKVLVVGGGGREHAIVKALSTSGSSIYSVMKNRNPGIVRLSKEFKLIKETDVEAVGEFALRSGVEMAVVGPESPLEAGLTDLLREKGIGCVGPSRSAARLETSKSFARNLLKRHRVPGNLDYASLDSFEAAKKYVLDSDKELAVKPVGLTGGKGVKIQGEHLRTKEDVIGYLKEIFDKKIGGSGVVLEERAVGEEFTMQAFVDGRTVAPMPLVQDHKRAYEGDKGPNTGGMGSYSMADHILPFVTPQEHEQALGIMKATVGAMAKEGIPYVGILYGQFMITKNGPRVIEFNARFGDPEAMNVLSILSSDFAEICQDIVAGTLTQDKVSFEKKATVCKYVVPEGYGTEPKSGREVKVDEKGVEREGAKLYYAMVNEEGGRILTTTSRAVAVVGIHDTLEGAEQSCERALRHVSGEAIYVRHDIGKPEVVRRRMERMAALRQ